MKVAPAIAAASAVALLQIPFSRIGGQMSSRRFQASLVLATFLFVCLVALVPASASTLYIGTDTEEFNSLPSSFLLIATVNGPNLVSESMITLSYPLNGIGDGPGYLYGG